MIDDQGGNARRLGPLKAVSLALVGYDQDDLDRVIGFRRGIEEGLKIGPRA